jgi:hypothetical protein
MNRSGGTTAIAIFQFIGSALLLALAAFMAFAMIVAPTPPTSDAQLPPHFFTAMRVVVPLFYALPAVWGIVTAVGLLQLKNWARISTIVISIFLILFGAFGMLTSMVFFLKPPAGNGVDPKMFAVIGAVSAMFALAQIGVGVWWMVFCNRASVKAQFLPQAYPLPYPAQVNMPYSATPPPPSLTTPGATSMPDPTPPVVATIRTARPLSISIIAWFMLVSCLFIPLAFFIHPPLALFLTILTGWHAMVFMLISGALNVYIGIALLKMKPVGRLIGIGYFIFGLLNVAVFYFAPGGNARLQKLLELQQSMFPWMRPAQSTPFQADMMPFVLVGAIGGVVFCLVLLYFLIAAKPAFDKAALERVG